MFKRIVNLELSQNMQHVINIVASVINMFVMTMISFGLSPYIVQTIGVEANGFVTLANNFISYVGLARAALNSMGSRFLMIAYYNDDNEKVERYYSSLFFADLILGVVFGVIGAACVWKLEYILNVPSEIVQDVRLLFSVLFLNYIISTIITVWSTATYVKNKLYLDSITSACNSIIRAMTIIGLFMCLRPMVSIVGIATLVSGVISYILQYYYKKNLFPDLKARISNFSWQAIRELLSSGVWNSISSLGTVLISHMDLLVANMFVGATDMGILAVAKTMPGFVENLNYTIASVFVPSLIIDYAKEREENVVATIKNTSKIISVICSLPLGFLLIYGKEFYSLWQPSQDARLLHALSIITIFGRVFFTGMQPLFDVFTVVNKVKQNSLVTLTNGFASIILTCILVYNTDLGIFAIAGVSVGCCFLKNMLFVIPFAARYLGVKMTTFYVTLVPSVLCCGILCVWGSFEKLFIPGDSWISLIIAGGVFTVFGMVWTAFVVLDKNERNYVLSILKSKNKKLHIKRGK